ncbi:hypothetical protein MTO96_000138 [Rhipicephalus appendiculatus]
MPQGGRSVRNHKTLSLRKKSPPRSTRLAAHRKSVASLVVAASAFPLRQPSCARRRVHRRRSAEAYGEAGRGVSGGFADWPTGMLTGRALSDVSVRQVLSLGNQLPSPLRRSSSLATLFARRACSPL